MPSGVYIRTKPVWNKGIKLTPEQKEKLDMSGLKKGQGYFKNKPEESHPSWAGDKVGYAGLHIWIKKHRGKPSKCERCKTTVAKKFDWASISRKYKRDLKDWIRLCCSCHSFYDKNKYPKEWLYNQPSQ